MVQSGSACSWATEAPSVMGDTVEDPVITGVRALPLRGATPDGGWSQGFDPDENLHTLIEVRRKH